VAKLVGPRTRLVTLSTFHSLGLLILKAERESLGMRGGFTIYDQADQLGLVRELLRQISIEDRRFDAKAILFRLSLAKNGFLSPEQYEERVRSAPREDEYDLIAAQLYPRYEQALANFTRSTSTISSRGPSACSTTTTMSARAGIAATAT